MKQQYKVFMYAETEPLEITGFMTFCAAYAGLVEWIGENDETKTGEHDRACHDYFQVLHAAFENDQNMFNRVELKVIDVMLTAIEPQIL